MSLDTWNLEVTFEEVREHLGMDTIWFWLAASQPINAMAYIYDGILFGAKDFVFLRKRMMEGFLLVFLPLVLWGFLKIESLLGLWLALIGLNGYRMLSGWWGCKRISNCKGSFTV